MLNNRTPMTELKVNDDNKTNDKTTIAKAATKYYGDLLDTAPDPDDMERTSEMMQYVEAEYDLWDDHNNEVTTQRYAGVSVSADMVKAAAAACKKRKTCISDCLVSEMWCARFDSQR